jgi:hypothetical protein
MPGVEGAALEIALLLAQAVLVAGVMAHDLTTPGLTFLVAQQAQQTLVAVAAVVAPVTWRMAAAQA